MFQPRAKSRKQERIFSNDLVKDFGSWSFGPSPLAKLCRCIVWWLVNKRTREHFASQPPLHLTAASARDSEKNKQCSKDGGRKVHRLGEHPVGKDGVALPESTLWETNSLKLMNKLWTAQVCYDYQGRTSFSKHWKTLCTRSGVEMFVL